MDWEFIKQVVGFFWQLFKGVFWNTKHWIFSAPAYLSIAALILYIWPRQEGEIWKTKMLVILRQYPGFIIMGFLLVSVVITACSLYVNKKPNFATPDELIPSLLQNKTIRLVDLAREGIVIRAKTFENCDIYGPAVVYQVNCTFNGLTMDAGPEDWATETTNKKVCGAVKLDTCIIKNCRFYTISFIGARDELSRIKVKTPEQK